MNASGPIAANAGNGSIADLALYIERRLGARHLPLATIVPISIVYAGIFVVGVLGNMSTCLVILRNKYMQTPTNVYLANLAVSDLLTHLVGE
jgi:neuromedin U receptor 1